MTRPVVRSVSQATRPLGSSARTASRIASEIWSASLSGCPSMTDSEVKRYRRPMTRRIIYSGSDAEAASRPRLSSHGQRFQKPSQPVADRPGKFDLGPVPRLHVVPSGRQDGRPVRLRAESRTGSTHLVGHQQIEVLLGELAAPLAHDVVGFGGEADQDLVLLLFS